MPTEESKLYLDLKARLENLSKGIAKHSTDPDFPKNLSSAAIDGMVTMLAQKRMAFVDASNIAHQKSEELNNYSDECEKVFSNTSSQIYGLHGKDNLEVEDYGLKIWQKRSGRKSKTGPVKAA